MSDDFYGEPCEHLKKLAKKVEELGITVESYEFNCRDVWNCKKCQTRSDPPKLLKKENYKIK